MCVENWGDFKIVKGVYSSSINSFSKESFAFFLNFTGNPENVAT